MLLLLWFLRRKIGPFGGRGIVTSGVKALAASLPMGVVVYYVCRLTDWSLDGHKLSKLLVLGGAISAGLLVYAAAARIVRSDEAIELSGLIRNKLGRRRV
jgi:putative peptidoglycan lipid II flippase